MIKVSRNFIKNIVKVAILFFDILFTRVLQIIQFLLYMLYSCNTIESGLEMNRSSFAPRPENGKQLKPGHKFNCDSIIYKAPSEISIGDFDNKYTPSNCDESKSNNREENFRRKIFSSKERKSTLSVKSEMLKGYSESMSIDINNLRNLAPPKDPNIEYFISDTGSEMIPNNRGEKIGGNPYFTSDINTQNFNLECQASSFISFSEFVEKFFINSSSALDYMISVCEINQISDCSVCYKEQIEPLLEKKRNLLKEKEELIKSINANKNSHSPLNAPDLTNSLGVVSGKLKSLESSNIFSENDFRKIIESVYYRLCKFDQSQKPLKEPTLVKEGYSRVFFLGDIGKNSNFPCELCSKNLYLEIDVFIKFISHDTNLDIICNKCYDLKEDTANYYRVILYGGKYRSLEGLFDKSNFSYELLNKAYLTFFNLSRVCQDFFDYYETILKEIEVKEDIYKKTEVEMLSLKTQLHDFKRDFEDKNHRPNQYVNPKDNEKGFFSKASLFFAEKIPFTASFLGPHDKTKRQKMLDLEENINDGDNYLKLTKSEIDDLKMQLDNINNKISTKFLYNCKSYRKALFNYFSFYFLDRHFLSIIEAKTPIETKLSDKELTSKIYDSNTLSRKSNFSKGSSLLKREMTIFPNLIDFATHANTHYGTEYSYLSSEFAREIFCGLLSDNIIAKKNVIKTLYFLEIFISLGSVNFFDDKKTLQNNLIEALSRLSYSYDNIYFCIKIKELISSFTVNMNNNDYKSSLDFIDEIIEVVINSSVSNTTNFINYSKVLPSTLYQFTKQFLKIKEFYGVYSFNNLKTSGLSDILSQYIEGEFFKKNDSEFLSLLKERLNFIEHESLKKKSSLKREAMDARTEIKSTSSMLYSKLSSQKNEAGQNKFQERNSVNSHYGVEQDAEIGKLNNCIVSTVKKVGIVKNIGGGESLKLDKNNRSDNMSVHSVMYPQSN